MKTNKQTDKKKKNHQKHKKDRVFKVHAGLKTFTHKMLHGPTSKRK